MLQSVNMDSDQFQLGKSKVFIKVVIKAPESVSFLRAMPLPVAPLSAPSPQRGWLLYFILWFLS